MIDVIAWVAVSASTVILSLVALYYALKRTSYNEETLNVAKESLKIQKKQLKIRQKMLRESRKYWSSWAERAKDVSRRVLEQMTEEELERELVRKRIERERRNHKS